MSSGSMQIPVWSLSGGTVGQSVVGLVSGLPQRLRGSESRDRRDHDDADDERELRGRLPRPPLATGGRRAFHLALFVGQHRAHRPACRAFSFANHPAGVLLPRAARCAAVGAHSARAGRSRRHLHKPTGLAMVKVTPLKALAKPQVVQDVSGYNSWPMMQAIGEKLVCVYSRGSAHTIHEGSRDLYARTSTDGGKTWTPETVVANKPDYGEVPARQGAGCERRDAPLGAPRRPRVAPRPLSHHGWRDLHARGHAQARRAPMQITDIFAVPKVGLMALWFAGDYGDKPTNSWGTVTSSDNGATWTQTTIESGLHQSRLAHRTRRRLSRRGQNPRHRPNRSRSDAVADCLH
jgi:hypothetical protein